MNKEYLYDWIYTFNPYVQEYQAVRRENYNDLFNDNSKAVAAASVDKLEEKIRKMSLVYSS